MFLLTIFRLLEGSSIVGQSVAGGNFFVVIVVPMYEVILKISVEPLELLVEVMKSPVTVVSLDSFKNVLAFK